MPQKVSISVFAVKLVLRLGHEPLDFGWLSWMLRAQNLIGGNVLNFNCCLPAVQRSPRLSSK